MFARRGKTLREDVIKFSLRQEDYINIICDKLRNGRYTFGKYREFYVYEPKKRRILAASFKDRIVHTWYVRNFIEKIFVPSFISTSYACIKGRGMHECALRVKKDLYNVNKKWEDAYVIKMDAAKYFQNINKNILLEIIEEKSKKYFVNNEEHTKYVMFTKKIIESSKEFDEVEEKGIPIGNYTSQMFGNIYLDTIDQYAKSKLKCKYYYRYMDDTCIIVENKAKAKEILRRLERMYHEVLELKLNSKTQIFKVSQGINFCGYKVKIGRMYLRNKGKKKLIKKLKYIRKNIVRENITVEEAKRSINGHVGYMKIADVNNLVKKYFYLNEYIK